MAQYVYILINPSLKGLLKIGRTDRTPEERAIELSNSSNMPTPFIVAYDEKVPDSQIAEKLIHDELMQQGFRVNESREFFSIPLKNAIQVVSQIAQQLRDAMPSIVGFSSETEIHEGSSAEYYYRLGMDAWTGSENTLQDYSAAHGLLAKAITFGCLKAHIFLGFLYIGGDGVQQSAERALKILKEGGDKGDPQCYQVMWTIYAGNTKLNLKHESNAEMCFQWFLNAAKEGVETTHLGDYLDHSYERLGGSVMTRDGNKYPISAFPGKFVSTVIDMWIGRLQRAFHKVRIDRLAGISLDEAETLNSPDAPSVFDVIQFQMFLSNCVQDGHDLMKQTMDGVTHEDLEYCFSRAKNVTQTVNNFIPYLSTQPTTAVIPTYNDNANLLRKPGFFSRFFS